MKGDWSKKCKWDKCKLCHECMREDDKIEFYDIGTVSGCSNIVKTQTKEEFYTNLKKLDIEELYHDIVDVIETSHKAWPADGPQNGDKPSYAGFFGRLAWHCAGVFR